jgi:hypothetical protein
MTMNRKIARLGAVTAAVAGLGAAGIMPLAGSASAATLPHTAAVAAATSGRWELIEPFTGYGIGALDLLACDTTWLELQKVLPQDKFNCVLDYNPPGATARNHYDLWTAWLEEWVAS